MWCDFFYFSRNACAKEEEIDVLFSIILFIYLQEGGGGGGYLCVCVRCLAEMPA